MKNNIDIVKNLIKILDKTCENNNSESARAIENVLSELETYKDKCIELSTDIDSLKTDYEETKETLKCTQDSWYKDTQELETYKKIEEKIKQKSHYCLEIPYEHCKKYTTAQCGKCIIDWARKEVENDE